MRAQNWHVRWQSGIISMLNELSKFISLNDMKDPKFGLILKRANPNTCLKSYGNVTLNTYKMHQMLGVKPLRTVPGTVFKVSDLRQKTAKAPCLMASIHWCDQEAFSFALF